MASKVNGVEVSEWARAPPTGSGWQRFLKSIYNPEEKSFLGRTAKRWGIVLIFYLVFYAGLTVLFSVCMVGLMYSLDEEKPMWTLKESLIGDSPGVAYRPLPVGDTFESVIKISYNDTNIAQLDHFFKNYKIEDTLLAGNVCVSADNYGYPDTPCVFIKLNKIFDWMPECYDESSLQGLKDMPEDLTSYISSLDADMRQQVWVSCWSEDPVQLQYPWGRGLKRELFPFRNQRGHVHPIVAVRVVPADTSASPITVHCRAWARNIRYHKSVKEPSGYTRVVLERVHNGTIE